MKKSIFHHRNIKGCTDEKYGHKQNIFISVQNYGQYKFDPDKSCYFI